MEFVHICREKKRWRSLVDFTTKKKVDITTVSTYMHGGQCGELGLNVPNKRVLFCLKNRLSWPDGEWDEVTFLPLCARFLGICHDSVLSLWSQWRSLPANGRRQNPISALICHHLPRTYSFRLLFLIHVYSFGNAINAFLPPLVSLCPNHDEHKCNGHSIPSFESRFYSFNSQLLLFLKEDCVTKEWNFPNNV